MPTLQDLLYDLVNRQDAGAGLGASPNVRMGLIEGQRMPPDPRMQGYAQQMAQAPRQAAPELPAMPAPTLSDRLYSAVSPGLRGRSGGGGGGGGGDDMSLLRLMQQFMEARAAGRAR